MMTYHWLKNICKKKDHSPSWGEKPYSYIQALTQAIAQLDEAAQRLSHAPEARLLSYIAFWRVINDPEMIQSFYDNAPIKPLSLAKVVSSFMHRGPLAQQILQRYWKQQAKGLGLKTLIKQVLIKDEFIKYPDVSVSIVYLYHSKHAFVAKVLQEKIPDLHAVCINDSIVTSLPVIKLPEPRLNQVHRFMKQFPYPENIAIQYCSMDLLFQKMKVNKLLTIEGTSPMELSSVFAARLHNIETVCVQYGWPPYLHAGFRQLPYHTFWLWGKGFEEKLAPHNPQAQFKQMGYFSNKSSSIQFTKKHSFQLVVALQGAVGYIQKRDWEMFLALIHQLSLLPIDIWVKEHPQIPLHDLNFSHNITIYKGDGSVLQALLKEAHAVLGIYSTTMIEAPLFDCIPIIYNPTELPSIHPEISEYRVGFECKTINEVLNTIEKLQDVENQRVILDNMQTFRLAYYQPSSSML